MDENLSRYSMYIQLCSNSTEYHFLPNLNNPIRDPSARNISAKSGKTATRGLRETLFFVLLFCQDEAKAGASLLCNVPTYIVHSMEYLCTMCWPRLLSSSENPMHVHVSSQITKHYFEAFLRSFFFVVVVSARWSRCTRLDRYSE